MRLLLALLLTSSLYAEQTISISAADCREIKSKTVLKEKLGFQSKSMFRGQIAVGELVKIYSANECPKTEKRSFSCVIGKPFREMEKEGIVTYRMYSGECLWPK